MWPHTGAILAGGLSTRMGEPKAHLPLPGGTMIEHVKSNMRKACSRVVVVGDGSHGSIDDLRPQQGPLAGVEAVLASGLDEQYLICPCDMPLLDWLSLCGLTGTTTATVTVFKTRDGEIRPLPARFHVDALPVVRAALDRGERAVHRVINRLDTCSVFCLGDPRQLVNINTPEEYRALRDDVGSP